MGEPFLPRPPEQINLDWPQQLDHLSANSLKTFARCPEQWRRRYCLGLKSRPSGAQVWGRADHQAVAINYAQKVESRLDMPTVEVQDAFVTALDREVEAEGGAGELEWDKKLLKGADAHKAQAQVKDQGARLVGAYMDNVSPKVQPLQVEQKFELDVQRLPVTVWGYIDLIAEPNTLPEGPESVFVGDVALERIIDRKTQARAASAPSGEQRLQAQIYQLARPLAHEWHLSVKSSGQLQTAETDAGLLLPAPSERKWEKTWLMLSQLVAQVGHLYQRYGPEHPWPGAIAHPWACSYCGWHPSQGGNCAWWVEE